MADNNKNPRRTIWLSETEPLSHYDIWLSKNQHLNSEGESIPDSRVLRPCDYIFKVWDCGDWHPIVGLNSTAVNKINTVYNTNYTTTHNGNSINSSSYLEFHLPLFTKPTSSPSELFDAGTIGDAILEYVTKEEWLAIFGGEAFSYAFKWYIEGGDLNIDLLLDPAEADKLGGIYADEFQEEDIFFEDFNNHSISLINHANDSWLALAKYKLGYNTSRPEDYNLYISAKDIIRIVKQYQHDNPDEPGITPGGGAIISPEVLYNSFLDSESIKRDWNDDLVLDASKPRFSLWGTSGVTALTNNAGKFLKIRNDAATWGSSLLNPYNESNNALVWQSAHDIVIEGTNYTGNTKKYLSCQNGEFNWETNTGNTYYGSTTISINQNNVISIAPYSGGSGEVYLCSNNNNVSWQPIDTGTTYILGVGIKINDEDNTINIKTDNAEQGLVLSCDGHGGVLWITVLSGGTEEYDAGDGIEIQTPLLGNKIIKGNIKECDLSGYNSGFSANTSIEFRAPTPEGAVLKNVVILNIDGGVLSGGSTYDLLPYTYTKINLAINGTITFIIDGQTSYVNGNPIYVILSIPTKTHNTYTINIKDSLDNDSNDFISINDALTSGSSSYTFGCDVNKFLITMQFGIVKIEPLGYIESNRTEPEQEPVE